MQTLRGLAARSLASGDSVTVRQVNAIVLALDGYALWKNGRPSEALRMLETARPGLRPYNSNSALPHGWWAGQILLELRRPAEAARFFRAQWGDPLSHYELAKIYDALGQREKARAEYEVFLAAWKDADPELQPIVLEARKALPGTNARTSLHPSRRAPITTSNAALSRSKPART